MDAGALRWILAIIGILVIAGVYLFAQHQNRIRRQGAIKTFTQDELENGLIEDENLRQELSSISTMLDQDDLKQDIGDLKINPALDANIKQSSKPKPAIHLPLVMQKVSDDNLIAHVLKHADDRVLTGMEIENAFQHIGLQVDDDGYARLQEYIVVLAPSHWKLRRTVKAVNQVIGSLRLEKHPDKALIGRIVKGFDFLG